MEYGVRPVVKRHKFDPPPPHYPCFCPSVYMYIFQRIIPESLTFCSVLYAVTILRYKHSVSCTHIYVNI
jgi:hypothetical protein